jgi:2-polyprenyl-3-methyl-5-hydroxy-6-metoxy-1,4-benzoquinol methylase
MKLTGKIKKWFNPNTKEYWDNLYLSEIKNGKVRQDKSVLRLVPLLVNKKTILDFGCGTGGNVKLLSQQVSGKKFYLLDHSTKVLEFVRNQYLKESDDQGNSFHYITDLKKISGTKFDVIISTQVLEHITDYSDVLNSLWEYDQYPFRVFGVGTYFSQNTFKKKR